jgi:hypothetical protein
MLEKSFNPQSFPVMREFLIDPNGKSLDGLNQLEEEIIKSKSDSNFKPQSHDDLLHQWISDAIFRNI